MTHSPSAIPTLPEIRSTPKREPLDYLIETKSGKSWSQLRDEEQGSTPHVE